MHAEGATAALQLACTCGVVHVAHLKCVSASGAPSGLPMWPACRWDSFTTFNVLGARAS